MKILFPPVSFFSPTLSASGIREAPRGKIRITRESHLNGEQEEEEEEEEEGASSSGTVVPGNSVNEQNLLVPPYHNMKLREGRNSDK